jgi:hypothetical protein
MWGRHRLPSALVGGCETDSLTCVFARAPQLPRAARPRACRKDRRLLRRPRPNFRAALIDLEESSRARVFAFGRASGATASRRVLGPIPRDRTNVQLTGWTKRVCTPFLSPLKESPWTSSLARSSSCSSVRQVSSRPSQRSIDTRDLRAIQGLELKLSPSRNFSQFAGSDSLDGS